jgi:hypothetical protein
MTTTTATAIPDVPLPAGAVECRAWDFEEFGESPQPTRCVVFFSHHLTDHDAHIEMAAYQYPDGTLKDFEIAVIDLEHGLNSAQARELASALLDAAAQLDRWVTR